jgi:signal transduction histidine kinase
MDDIPVGVLLIKVQGRKIIGISNFGQKSLCSDLALDSEMTFDRFNAACQLFDKNNNLVTLENHPFTRAIKQGVTIENEEWLVKYAGDDPRYVSLVVHPVFHNGMLLFGISVWTDIVVRNIDKAYFPEPPKFFEAIFEKIFDVYLVVNRKWYVLDINKQALRVFNKSKKELIDNVLWASVPDAFGSELHMKLECAFVHNCTVHFETVSSCGNYWFEAYGFPQNDTLGVYLRDITERKEKEIQQQKRTLELEKSYADLERFTSYVSHDLRAPLRIINSYTQIISDQYREVLDTEGQGLLKNIADISVKLNEMLDDLLRLSRLSYVQLQITDVNISEMLEQITTQTRKEFPGRTVRVDIQPEIICRCDKNLIRIALENILRNAWKFTINRNPAIIESGSFSGINGERIYFIKDNGIGFDMKFSNKLFVPFQRLHSQKEARGTGVGLSIVEKIISRHNGRIWAKSEPDKGTTFFFTLGDR